VNNFASDRDNIILKLAELGAHDLVREAREFPDATSETLDAHFNEENSSSGKEELFHEQNGLKRSPGNDSSAANTNEDGTTLDIDRFMPVKKIHSEKEALREKDIVQNIYHDTDATSSVKIVDAGKIRIPFSLSAFVQDMGDITSFPPAKLDNTNKLGYYLMDAASLLPVIALGLEPDCDVLDLCAAPGGKSLAMLQTLLPGRLTCVDISLSRLRRLKDVLSSYAPRSYISDAKVSIVHLDGLAFCAKSEVEEFDRVLVDVPCFVDRHSLEEEDNNIFRPSRLAERVEMSRLQQNLLFAAIKRCRPGGVVVYSTCTLSPVQNDGVIAATLEQVWQKTNIEVVVETLKSTTDRFASTFQFYDGTIGNRFGALVLPKLTANFGPMYICRLRRIR